MAKSAPVEGQLRLFEPASDWKPPSGPLPRLRDEIVAIDTETRDLGLAEGRGPGWVHREGYILGASVAWSGGALYVPTAHLDTENRPIEELVDWIDGLLRNCHCVFFNGPYDMGWLRTEGCTAWPERMEDAQAQAVMLDENWDSYSLDSCCARAGVPGKDESLLLEAAATYGIAPVKGSIKHGLWRLPAKHVGPYAEQDAVSTLQLYRTQRPMLEAEETTGAYRTEIALMRVLHEMRRRGIRISESGAEAAQVRIRQESAATLAAVSTPPIWHRRATIEDIRSPERLAEIFDAEGVKYPRTAKTGQPSFTKDFLKKCGSPVAKNIMRARQLHDLSEKFIGTYILNFTKRGRIHAEIHQLRNDEGGARTNRLSYSNPPLQQMPSRDAELAPVVRGSFLPEEGADWLAADFKSQEPRLTTHFAAVSQKVAAGAPWFINMRGVDDLVDYYRNDPDPDPHLFTSRILELTRRETKDLTQGLTYRMQAKKLAWHMNISLAEANKKWNLFHQRVPYIQGLAKFSEALGQERGYIRMIDGARRHFPLWQQRRNWKEEDDDSSAARLEVAQQRWPGQALERAFAYQAMNSLVQGSAARQIKKSIVECHRAGYLAMVSMHDENDFPVTSARECREIGEIMAGAVRLVVPVTCDLEVGPNWGKAKTNYLDHYREVAA